MALVLGLQAIILFCPNLRDTKQVQTTTAHDRLKPNRYQLDRSHGSDKSNTLIFLYLSSLSSNGRRRAKALHQTACREQLIHTCMAFHCNDRRRATYSCTSSATPSTRTTPAESQQRPSPEKFQEQLTSVSFGCVLQCSSHIVLLRRSRSRHPEIMLFPHQCFALLLLPWHVYAYNPGA